MLTMRAIMAAANNAMSKWPIWDGTLDGAEYVWNSGNSTNISLARLSSTTVIVFYTDGANSNYATACVGTVSGSVISWGTPVVVHSSACQINSLVALSSTQALVGWRDNGDASKAKAVVLDISGTGVTVNSIVTVESSAVDSVYAAKLSSTKVIVAYNVTSTEGRAVVLSISGSSITVNTYYAFGGSGITAVDCSVEAISVTQAVVIYSDGGNSGYGTAQVLDIDGSNVITGNTGYVFNSATTTALRSTAMSSSLFMVIYKDGGNSNYYTVQAVVISGVTPSSGTKQAFNAATAARTLMNIARADKDNAYVFFRQASTNKGTALIATLAGSVITLQSVVIVNDATSAEFACVALDASRICIGFKDQGNSNAGTGRISST